MIQRLFVVKRTLWINQKGFLNYKRYCFLNVFVFFCGIKAVSEVGFFYTAPKAAFSAHHPLAFERFDGLAYQGQVRISKNTVPFSFCGS